MKKFIVLILTLFLCSGLIVTSKIVKANALEEIGSGEIGGNVSGNGSIYVSPHIILNQESGCYDIDIYIGATNKYISNFAVKIGLAYPGSQFSGEGLQTKTTAQSYVGGTISSGNIEGDVEYAKFRLVFNATKNVDLSAIGYTLDRGNDLLYFGKIAKIKTDIKIANMVDTEKTHKALLGLCIDGGEIESAAYINDNKKVVNYDNLNEVENISMLLGDFDFDGELTARDLVTAQYYYVNDVMLIGGGIGGFLTEFCRNSALQYLQMYLCEQITYSEYVVSVVDAMDGGSGGGGSEEVVPGESVKEGDYPDGAEGQFYDVFWDYDFWNGNKPITDENGNIFYGEDNYGNYHFWLKNSEGYYLRLFIAPSSTVYSYSLSGGRIAITDYERIGVGNNSYEKYWDNEYWDSKTPGEDGSYVIKGLDSHGNLHVWEKDVVESEKIFGMSKKYFEMADGNRYRYIISAKDNKILIVGQGYNGGIIERAQ